MVSSGGSYVSKLERKFVEKRLRRRLLLGDGTMVNELSKYGIKAIALGMAGAWWAAIGFVILVLGIAEKWTFSSDGNWLKWTGLSISALCFLMYLFRTIQSILDRLKYRAYRR